MIFDLSTQDALRMGRENCAMSMENDAVAKMLTFIKTCNESYTFDFLKSLS